MKNTIVIVNRVAHLLNGFALACLFILAVAPAAHGAGTWKDSFEDICSKVDASSTLNIKELEALIDQADKLAPEIQRSDDPAKKVYLRRLKNCRSMFEFSIDTKKNSGK